MCICGLENYPLIKLCNFEMGSPKVSMKRSSAAASVFILNWTAFPLCDRNDSVHYLQSNTYRETFFVPYILMFDADGYLLSFIGAFDTNALSCLGAPARPFQHPMDSEHDVWARGHFAGDALKYCCFVPIDAKEKKERHTSSQWPINPESFCLSGQRRCDILCQTSTWYERI